MQRLAYFVSHPIQYQAPLLRQLAADPDISFKVFFFSDFSLRAYRDADSPGGLGQSIQWDIPLTDGYDYHFLDCWGSKQRKNIFVQPIAKDIAAQLKIGQFDAVWVHGWFWLCNLQAILAAKDLGIPVLFRGDTNGLTEPTSPVKKEAKRILFNWLSSKIDRFLYIGTLNHRFYQTSGVPQEKLFSMPYAVDNNYFQQGAKTAHVTRESLRQSLNLEAGRPIILYAGRLILVKRPLDLLNAYRFLSSDGIQEPEPYLLFAGEGDLRPELEAAAQATGWNSIRFLGFQNQSYLPGLYDLCDVFVLPSNFEPWGLTINEVLNAGKAVVLSDKVGCGLDLVSDGQNGRIFSVGDIPDLVESIQWAIAHAQTAGEHSLKKIQNWGIPESIAGLKISLRSLQE